MTDEPTIRDLQGRTNYAPGPPEYDRAAVADPPLPEAARPIFGAAIVTANSGGGAYTITEARRSDGALVALEAPHGFVDRVAHAIGDTTEFEVDDEVLYWQVPNADGSYATYIERGRMGSLSPVHLGPEIGDIDSLVDRPLADTWDRADQGANAGFSILLPVAGLTDGGLAAFAYRLVTFDSAGNLVTVGIEQIVNV